MVLKLIFSHESVRQWALKFGQDFANRIRRRLPRTGDKWHLDEVVLKIAGRKHWLLASRGSDRCGAPTPTHKAGRQAPATEAAEEADAAAPCHDH